jgi:hypothetical protein
MALLIAHPHNRIILIYVITLVNFFNSLARILEGGGSSNYHKFHPGKEIYKNHGSAETFSDLIAANIIIEVESGRRTEISKEQLDFLPFYCSNPLGALS